VLVLLQDCLRISPLPLNLSLLTRMILDQITSWHGKRHLRRQWQGNISGFAFRKILYAKLTGDLMIDSVKLTEIGLSQLETT
jgi:hypothetical protein